jgi:hypothetical protein
MQWDHRGEGRAALQAESGNLLVRGCEFQEDKLQAALGKSVQRAVITGNIIKGKLNIANQSKGSVIVKDNASDDRKADAPED